MYLLQSCGPCWRTGRQQEAEKAWEPSFPFRLGLSRLAAKLSDACVRATAAASQTFPEAQLYAEVVCVPKFGGAAAETRIFQELFVQPEKGQKLSC